MYKRHPSFRQDNKRVYYVIRLLAKVCNARIYTSSLRKWLMPKVIPLFHNFRIKRQKSTLHSLNVSLAAGFKQSYNIF